MRSRGGVSVTVQISTGRCTSVDKVPGQACRRRVGRRSDIQEPDVLGVAGDEAAAGFDVLAHEDAEQLVGGRGVLDGDLQQDAGLGVHGGLPQLLGVHLAQALEPLDRVVLHLAARLGGEPDGRFLLAVGVDVLVAVLAAPLDLVQRRLGEVDVAGLDQRAHEAEQQREQQSADVLAVDVGVRHQDDLVIAELRQVELVVDAGAEGSDHRLDLVVLEDPVDARLLDVDDLAADRQDRLEHRVAPRLGRTTGRVALDDVDLRVARVGGAAVGQLARQRVVGEQVLAGKLAGVLRRAPSPGRRRGLVDDHLGLGRVRLEPVPDLLVADLLHEALDLGVAELGLRLALELRVAELHRDDRGETLADVLTRELLVLLLEDLLVHRVAVDDRGQRGAEALLVGAALVRVDRVGERVDRLRVRVGPLHRDVEAHRHVVLAHAVGGEADDGLVDRGLLGVDVLDVVLEPAVVPVDDLGGLEGLLLGPGLGRGLGEGDLPGHAGLGLALTRALVAQDDGQALVEERHLLQPAADRVERVVRRLEDVVVGPEGDLGAALLGGADLLQRPGLGQFVLLRPLGAVAPDTDVEPLRQRVDDGDTDAVQTTGDRVALAVELAAGVQDRHDDLDGRTLLDRVHVDRDATAVVLDPDAAIGEQGDVDLVRVPGQRLVDGVVDDLPDHVVQAALTGGADVHTGALANRIEALENGDGATGVGVLRGSVGLRSSDHVGPSFRATGTPLPASTGSVAQYGTDPSGRRSPLGRLLAVSAVQTTGWSDRNAAVHALTSRLRLSRPVRHHPCRAG